MCFSEGGRYVYILFYRGFATAVLMTEFMQHGEEKRHPSCSRSSRYSVQEQLTCSDVTCFIVMLRRLIIFISENVAYGQIIACFDFLPRIGLGECYGQP